MILVLSVSMTAFIGLLSLMRHSDRRISPYEKGLMPVLMLSFLISLCFSMLYFKTSGQPAAVFLFWKQSILVLSVLLGLVFIYFVHTVIIARQMERFLWSAVFVFAAAVFVRFYFILREFHVGQAASSGAFMPAGIRPFFVFYTALFFLLFLRLFIFSRKILHHSRKIFIRNFLFSMVFLIGYFLSLMFLREGQTICIQFFLTLWFGHLVLFEILFLKDEVLWDIQQFLNNLILFFIVLTVLLVLNAFMHFFIQKCGSMEHMVCHSFILAPAIFFMVLLFQSIARELNKKLFMKIERFQHNLRSTAIYARPIFDLKTFQKFLENLFDDYPEAEDVTAFSIDSGREFSVVSSGGVELYSLKEDEKAFVERIFSFPYIMAESARRHGKEGQEPTFLSALGSGARFVYLFPLMSKEKTSIGFALKSKRWLMHEEIQAVLDEKENVMLALNNIFVFQKEREKALEMITEMEEEQHLKFLQEQNEKLIAAYKEIQIIQEELIKKERKASVVQITLSLDSEISNPLTNILIPLQFILHKIKKGEAIDPSRIKFILEIIENESKKIKNILEKMRQVIERWSKIDIVDDSIMKGIETDFFGVVGNPPEDGKGQPGQG